MAFNENTITFVDDIIKIEIPEHVYDTPLLHIVHDRFIFSGINGGGGYFDLTNGHIIKTKNVDFCFTFSVDNWEEENEIKHNVEVKIYFTEKGWDRFINILDII